MYLLLELLHGPSARFVFLSFWFLFFFFFLVDFLSHVLALPSCHLDDTLPRPWFISHVLFILLHGVGSGW